MTYEKWSIEDLTQLRHKLETEISWYERKASEKRAQLRDLEGVLKERERARR